MVSTMAVVTQYGKIREKFLAIPLVGSVMHFESLIAIADLTPILSRRQSLLP
jgi:hypothetical protein